MKNVTVYADMHLFGPTPVKPELIFGENVYYIGDNHEFKNIRKKELDENKLLFKAFLEECESTNTNILRGNHEVVIGFNNIHYHRIYDEETRTLFTHGHRIFWEMDKVDKWELRKPCKPWYKIEAIRIKNELGKKCGSSKFSEEKIRIINNHVRDYEFLTSREVRNIVFGHTHPKQLIDETHCGIRMINVPRGKTELKLEVVHGR